VDRSRSAGVRAVGQPFGAANATSFERRPTSTRAVAWASERSSSHAAPRNPAPVNEARALTHPGMASRYELALRPAEAF
jgi:hypothetical protein